MVERLFGPVIGHRLLFVVLACALFFLRLLPLDTAAGRWAGPDLLLCLTIAWTLRRPDFLPFWLVGMVIFVEDILSMRPPGLWTALVIAGSEFLRSRMALMRGVNFGLEWLFVTALMAGIFLSYRMVLGFAIVPQAPFGQAALQFLATVLFYPAVVGLSWAAFGIGKPAIGEIDASGRRL
jgi:rod shape-determining protein MreD